MTVVIEKWGSKRERNEKTVLSAAFLRSATGVECFALTIFSLPCLLHCSLGFLCCAPSIYEDHSSFSPFLYF
uniref:Uncharacterized protein n=1 Tax=Manihot esculenta TaxID=3983 RepID=A0A2C9UIP8_MANES